MPADNAAKIDLSIIKLSFYGGQCWSWVAALDQHVTIGAYNISNGAYKCKIKLALTTERHPHGKLFAGQTNY